MKVKSVPPKRNKIKCKEQECNPAKCMETILQRMRLSDSGSLLQGNEATTMENRKGNFNFIVYGARYL